MRRLDGALAVHPMETTTHIYSVRPGSGDTRGDGYPDWPSERTGRRDPLAAIAAGIGGVNVESVVPTELGGIRPDPGRARRRTKMARRPAFRSDNGGNEVSAPKTGPGHAVSSRLWATPNRSMPGIAGRGSSPSRAPRRGGLVCGQKRHSRRSRFDTTQAGGLNRGTQNPCLCPRLVGSNGKSRGCSTYQCRRLLERDGRLGNK